MLFWLRNRYEPHLPLREKFILVALEIPIIMIFNIAIILSLFVFMSVLPADGFPWIRLQG